MGNNYMKPLDGFENKSNEQPVVQTNENNNNPPPQSDFTATGRIYMKPIIPLQSSSDVNQIQPSANNESDEIRYAFEINHLTHTFDEGTEHEFKIFDNFTLKVEDKPNISEVVSIMGGSGCGKSCLLKMAAGLMTPQSGEIKIHGEHIDEYKSAFIMQWDMLQAKCHRGRQGRVRLNCQRRRRS